MPNTQSLLAGSGWDNKNEQPALDNAIAALTTLLQDYPDSPYAAEAHYWLGDCHDRLEIMAKQYHTIKRSSVAIPTTQSPTRHSCASAERTKHKVTSHWHVLPTTHSPNGAKTRTSLPKRKNGLHVLMSNKRRKKHPSILHLKLRPPESPQVTQPNPPKTPPEVTKPPPPPAANVLPPKKSRSQNRSSTNRG